MTVVFILPVKGQPLLLIFVGCFPSCFVILLSLVNLPGITTVIKVGADSPIFASWCNSWAIF